MRAEDEDKRLAGSVTGYASVSHPVGPGASITEVGIVLDADWFAQAVPSDPTAAKTVVLHEMAHAFGLGHAEDPASIMYPSGPQPGPTADDLVALRQLGRPCPTD
jgi:hypothetical protein